MKTLDATGSSTVRLVVNTTGSAIITWSDDDNVWADSGTILGGLPCPVDIGHALAHYHSPRVSVVALNNTGQAPAGSSIWSTPAVLTSDFVSSGSVVGDAAGTFIVALVTTVTVNNTAVETVNVFTSSPSGTFGTPTTFSVTLFDNLDLNIAADARRSCGTPPRAPSSPTRR